jgi:hypothetical protein
LKIPKDINLEYFKREVYYFFENYTANFIAGVGTEEILNCFNKFFSKGTWVDLGGGSSSLLWWGAQRYNNKIILIDKCIEPMILTNILRNSSHKIGCYKYVEEQYGKKDFKKLRINFIIKDLFEDKKILKGKYKNISQIGLLGLCKDEGLFINELANILSLLSYGGVLISANWIFTDEYSKKRGINNNYLCEKTIENFVSKNNKYKLCYQKTINYTNDEKYKGVLIYVLKKEK